MGKTRRTERKEYDEPPATEQKLYKLYGETYRQRKLVNPFLYVGLTRENKYHF